MESGENNAEMAEGDTMNLQDDNNSGKIDENQEHVQDVELFEDFEVDTLEDFLVFEPKCTWNWFPG